MNRHNILTLALITSIIINGYCQVFSIFSNARGFQQPPYPPGYGVISLKPYLKGISWIGYYGDNRTSVAFSDVRNMSLYQQAQFCLSPTLLDYYNPLAYQLIIFNFKDQAAAYNRISEIHGRVIAVTREGDILVRRDK